MLMKIISYPLAAGTTLLSLSSALKTQDAAPSPKQFLTPWGYRDSANFHDVPDGYELATMPDGHVRIENPTTGDKVDFAKPAAKAVKPLPDNGWQTAASWYTGFDIGVRSHK
jgi:hypothetical protein